MHLRKRCHGLPEKDIRIGRKKERGIGTFLGISGASVREKLPAECLLSVPGSANSSWFFRDFPATHSPV